LELVITLGDVLGDKEERAIGESLLVHGDKSISSGSRIFIADEPTVLSEVSFIALNVSGLNFSVLGEHSGQFHIVGAGRETLHEKVGEFSVSSATFTSLILGLMEEDLEVFASE
jgi:hypothetical protein